MTFLEHTAARAAKRQDTAKRAVQCVRSVVRELPLDKSHRSVVYWMCARKRRSVMNSECKPGERTIDRLAR